MIAALIVTHGRLAMELLETAHRIVPDLENVEAISIGWHDEVESTRNHIAEALRRLDRDGGAIILTDMFGGTPTNIALSFLERGKVEVVTGVNLPMLLRLAGLVTSASLLEAVREISAQGQRSIYVASEVLTRAEG